MGGSVGANLLFSSSSGNIYSTLRTRRFLYTTPTPASISTDLFGSRTHASAFSLNLTNLWHAPLACCDSNVHTHTHTHTHSDSYRQVTVQTWANCWCSSGWNCNAAWPDGFVLTVFCLQINNPSFVIITGCPTHRVAFSHRCVCLCLCHLSFTLQRLHEVCMVVPPPPKCHFTGHLHRVATGMQMSTPTSRLPPRYGAITHSKHTHTLRADFYSHARAQTHPKSLLPTHSVL